MTFLEVSLSPPLVISWTHLFDFARLRDLTETANNSDLARLLATRAEEEIETTKRDPRWSESPAVGDEFFLRQFSKLK